MDCIFCKIISGEIPSSKIYEDENVISFLDIAPVNYGHSLVVPKKHYATLEEIPEEELCEIIKVVKGIGRALKSGLGSKGYSVQMNNDPVAGQVVPHLHFHLVPRSENDNLELWPGGKYANGEIEEAAQKIKSVL